jgi:hypothetical protein
LIQIFFVVRLFPVLLNCEVGDGDPIGFNEWKQEVVKEWLTDLLGFLLEVYIDSLTCNLQEFPLCHELNNGPKFFGCLHSISENEFFIQ